MNTIHILDENTANKIAAGEVVERPASIIKELVENSVDAGSTSIEVEIADGGISFIRVTDNGSGMNSADAQVAILRHATSKIRQAEDLTSISSLGFRGEALPSIAAVSKFSLTTRLHTESLATFIQIEGGSIVDVREAGANVGTTIIVEDLFYNIPARRKFLKTTSTESSYINDILTKLSLSYPAIAFKLINNKRLVLSTNGNNQLEDTLISLYGHKIAPEIMPLNYANDENNIRITGFLAKPTLLKSSRQWQTYIVNGRVINSRSIAKAIDNAYHSLLPKSGYPLAVLNITVPSENVDVNVHPQKSEVKFSEEQKIFRAVYKAVTDVLIAPHKPTELATTVEFKNNSVFKTPSFSKHENIKYQPIKTQTVDLWKEEAVPFKAAQNIIIQDKASIETSIAETASTVPDEAGFTLQVLGQVDDCYIISSGEDGLYIVDQHAAHERILFDKLSQYTDRIPSQQLLVPSFIDFDASEINIITEYQQTFYQLGFGLDLVGPTTMRLFEMPSDIPLAEAENSIRQILEAIQNLQKPTSQELRLNLLQITACRAAIKAGQQLNMRQMQALINELCNTKLPYTCPHGRPSMIRFSGDELAKMFKRT